MFFCQAKGGFRGLSCEKCRSDSSCLSLAVLPAFSLAQVSCQSVVPAYPLDVRVSVGGDKQEVKELRALFGFTPGQVLCRLQLCEAGFGTCVRLSHPDYFKLACYGGLLVDFGCKNLARLLDFSGHICNIVTVMTP